MYKMLGDRETYITLKNNPMHFYKNELSKLVSKGYKQGILDKKAFLVPLTTHIPVIYYLPKNT